MTSGNPILDKNLECIAKYNPQLKEKLLLLPFLESQIELVETNLNEPNLTLNGLPLHSQQGAEMEAKELFQRVVDTKLSMHVIFGMGLGHLFKEFCENSKGSVILYEPNLEILRVTLELVDFSNEFSKKNVKIASDYFELKDAFEAIYNYKAEIDLTVLDSYKNLYTSELSPLFKQLETLRNIFSQEFNTKRSRGMEFVTSVLENLGNTLEATPLLEFKDIYKGKTALIISAGPTLDSNIEIIKKNRNKFIIFCVGTAFKAIEKEGITPDFINIVEAFDHSGQVKGLDLSNINLIVEPSTNKAFQSLKVKQKFLYPAITSQSGQYWSHLTGIDISGYNSGGTVSYQALECAKMLGFTKLILVGQDLAYVDNKCYSNNSNCSGIFIETNQQTQAPEFKIKDKEKLINDCMSLDDSVSREKAEEMAETRLKVVKEALCYVKSITGEMLPTYIGYANFVEQFKEFAHCNKDLELINTSMIGAQIDGFKNIPLAKAIESDKPIQKKELSSQFNYHKRLILNNLVQEKELLERILTDFKKTEEYFYKFERDLKRSNTLTKDAVKYYKLLLEVYDKVTVDYFEKNQLFQLISLAETLDLKHYTDITDAVGDERAKNICKLMKAYFQNNATKISILINEIDNQIMLIDEDQN